MKKAAFGFALILAALALVACGGSNDNSSTTGGETTSESGAADGGEKSNEAEGKSAGGGGSVSFEADPGSGLAYTTKTATAKAGKVTIDFTNPQPLSHDVAIEGPSGETIAKTEIIAEGSDSTVANLKPGEYTFYCSVPGHREAGMEGTLTVK
jgi:plastocyanin